MIALTPSSIRNRVADHFGITPNVLICADQSRHAVNRRAVGYALCNMLTDASPTEIGRVFGHRDQSTVRGALAKPLPFEYQTALEILSEALQPALGENRSLVRRFPFKSRRTPAVPTFFRRYTA